MTAQRDPGREFDLKMASYFAELRQSWTSRRGFLRLAAGSAGAAALTAALGGPSEAAKRRFLPGLYVLAQDETSVTFALEGDVRGLEPALSYDFTANPVACNISEGLLKFTPDGALEPLIAESFEQTDELTYVYTLRDGVLFSDGTPVTADDVVASIARVRDPEVAGPLAWMYDVPGATVEKTDDKTITITLATPARSSATLRPRPPGTSFLRRRSSSTVSTSCVTRGTGPYKFVKWEAGSEIVLEKNPNYWQEGKPHFERFIYKIVEEGTTRVTGLKTGEINMMTRAARPARSRDGLRKHQLPGSRRLHDQPHRLAQRQTTVRRRQHSQGCFLRTPICKRSWRTSSGRLGVQSTNTAVPPNMPGSASDELEPIPYRSSTRLRN